MHTNSQIRQELRNIAIAGNLLKLMAPSLTMPESCVVVRLRDGMGGQGDIVPGERCGVWSFHTRDTCWSSMSWSLSSSNANFSRIASANARSLAFDRSLFPGGAPITRYTYSIYR